MEQFGNQPDLETPMILRSFFEVSPVPFAISNRDGQILYANAPYIELLGLEREGPREILIADFYADRKAREAMVAKMRANSGTLQDEVIRARRRDGSLFWCSVSARSAQLEGCEVFFSICKDVSEQILSENALRLREHQLALQNRALVELTSSDLLSAADWPSALHSITEICARTLEVERASVWLFDGDRQHLRCADVFRRSNASHDHGMLLAASSCPRYFEALESTRIHRVEQAATDPGSTEFREFYLEPQGIRSLLHAPVRVEGRIEALLFAEHVGPAREWTPEEEHFAASMADMVAMAMQARERRRAEQELEERIRKDQKLEAVGQVAGGIAHDYNNLLKLILGHVELARCSDDPVVQRHLDAVREAAERGNGLTRRLLAFSGQQVMVPARIDLNRHIHERAPRIRDLLASSVGLDLQLESSLPMIQADPAQIDQILLNLAANAQQAMGEQGRLEIRTEIIPDPDGGPGPLASPPQPWVCLQVSDTGRGMDEEELERCFDPLFRRSQDPCGTGMGLSIVHGAVSQHGGRIEVSSRPKHGTQIRVLLPVLGTADGTQQGPARILRERRSILIAEDEEPVRRLNAITLEHAGYRVLTAADGEEAISMFDAHQDECALLILDLVVSKVRDVQVWEHARRQRKVHALLVRGASDPTLPRRPFADPAVGVLRKPFTTAELLREVQQAFPRAGISFN